MHMFYEDEIHMETPSLPLSYEEKENGFKDKEKKTSLFQNVHKQKYTVLKNIKVKYYNILYLFLVRHIIYFHIWYQFIFICMVHVEI